MALSLWRVSRSVSQRSQRLLLVLTSRSLGFNEWQKLLKSRRSGIDENRVLMGSLVPEEDIERSTE